MEKSKVYKQLRDKGYDIQVIQDKTGMELSELFSLEKGYQSYQKGLPNETVQSKTMSEKASSLVVPPKVEKAEVKRSITEATGLVPDSYSPESAKRALHPVAGQYGVTRPLEAVGQKVGKAVRGSLPQSGIVSYTPSVIGINAVSDALTPSFIQQGIGGEAAGVVLKTPQVQATKEWAVSKVGRSGDIMGGFPHGTVETGLKSPEVESLSYYKKNINPFLEKAKSAISDYETRVRNFFNKALTKYSDKKGDIVSVEDINKNVDNAAQDLGVTVQRKTTTKRGTKITEFDETEMGVKGRETSLEGGATASDVQGGVPRAQSMEVYEGKTSPIKEVVEGKESVVGVKREGKKTKNYVVTTEKEVINPGATATDVSKIRKIRARGQEILGGKSRANLKEIVELRQEVGKYTEFRNPNDSQIIMNNLYNNLNKIIKDKAPEFKRADGLYHNTKKLVENTEEVLGVSPKSDLNLAKQADKAEKTARSFLGMEEGVKQRVIPKLEKNLGKELINDARKISASAEFSDIGGNILSSSRKLPIKWAIKTLGISKKAINTLPKTDQEAIVRMAIQEEVARNRNASKK